MHLRELLREAIKSGDTVKKNILRVVLSDLDLIQGRSGKEATEEDAHRTMRKLLLANQESIEKLEEIGRETTILQQENEYLMSLLPKSLSEEELLQILNTEEIRHCPKEGQAIGIAMKMVKNRADGSVVAKIVKQVRKS